MRRLLVIAAVLALLLLVYHRLALSGLILARGDTFNYFYPYWAARDQALSILRIPLWSPDLFMGVPLLANPQLGALYFPNWITSWLTPPDAIRASILLHVVWAVAGAFWLARRVLEIGIVPALIAGVTFGLGGYAGAHAEQINQLQGLAWMPWVFLAFHYAWRRPLVYTAPFAAAIALQILSGHTQTFFITGVGLVIYTVINVLVDLRAISFIGAAEDWRLTLVMRILRGLAAFAIGAVIALVLTLPQLWPSLELTGISNRGAGFSPQQAMAFSWEPALVPRSLLPSYDAQIFSEFIAYTGVFGLALALVGTFSKEMGRWRVVWVVIALVGLFFALGLYNPVYWSLAGLPGFNLFRVPARWLALFALAAAMLAGMGAHMLIANRRYQGELGSLGVIGVILTLLVVMSLLTNPSDVFVDGPENPTILTLAAWAAVFVLFVNIVLLRQAMPPRATAAAISLVVGAELFFASLLLPINDVTERAAYFDPRFTVQQLQALQPPDSTPPGRVLSVSTGLFDVGDKADIEARLNALGVTSRARDYTLTAAKLKELVAPNQALVWGIPSIDGYDGGVLPTMHYTQFTSLLLPEGEPRTIDGRLRELLARAGCGAVCLPDARWLNLTNTQYLIVDKVYDQWIDGVAFDTALHLDLTAGERAAVREMPEFEADAIHVLYREAAPRLLAGASTAALAPATTTGTPSGDRLAVYTLPRPLTLAALELVAAPGPDVTVSAVTLVDTRTGDFAQVTLGPWRKLLSSDIKLYENLDVLPRAFVVHAVSTVPDTWQGTEDTLALMAAVDFDPARQAVLATKGDLPMTPPTSADVPASTVTFVDYEPTRIDIKVNAAEPGYLILTDAYFDGWRALVNWSAAPLYRANGMFRAVPIPAGESDVVFEFRPDWYPLLPAVGALAWGLLLVATIAIVSRTARREI